MCGAVAGAGGHGEDACMSQGITGHGLDDVGKKRLQ